MDLKCIKEFLRENLGGHSNSSYVASRIVYEAMTNGIRHPGGSLIVAASFCDDRHPRGKNSLTITFWDNGTSMAITISEALKAKKIVRSNVPLSENFAFNVDLITNETKTIRFIRRTDKSIEPDNEIYEYFLACLFPGVSRDLPRETYISEDKIIGDDEDKRLTDSGPGYGLTDLLNCACEIFKGTVVFRSGTLMAKVRECNQNEEGRYKVVVTDFGNRMPSFNGNMLSIKIPLEG